MTAKADGFEDDILQLLFRNTVQGVVSSLNITAGAAGNLYMALHTASPGEGGSQTTNEIAYTGYARQLLAQGTGNWTKATNDTVQNASAITFGQRTNTGTATATHVSIGTALTGAGSLMYHGALDASLVVNQNVNPQFAVNALKIQET